jgi:hypothetical protein
MYAGDKVRAAVRAAITRVVYVCVCVCVLCVRDECYRVVVWGGLRGCCWVRLAKRVEAQAAGWLPGVTDSDVSDAASCLCSLHLPRSLPHSPPLQQQHSRCLSRTPYHTSLPLFALLQLTLYLRLLAEYPASKTASGVEVTVPLPRSVQRVHCETGKQCSATVLPACLQRRCVHETAAFPCSCLPWHQSQPL